MQNHYETLCVTPNADQKAIEGAYKYLSREYHPDKHPDNKVKYQRIQQQLNDAYAVIGNPAKRKTYDNWLKDQAIPKQQKPSTQSEPIKSSNTKDHESEEVDWILLGSVGALIAILIKHFTS